VTFISESGVSVVLFVAAAKFWSERKDEEERRGFGGKNLFGTCFKDILRMFQKQHDHYFEFH
jgi:hypothetical protein